MKKGSALFLVLCILLSVLSAAAASSFSDVSNDFWGKSSIDDMTERGLFTGYSDGTFRPDANITLLESLVLLSRLCDADAETKELVLADHKTQLAGLLSGKGYDWAYANLAICLETGIVTSDELEDFIREGTLSSPVAKEVLSVFLVRAMQLEDEALALSVYKLNFSDNLSITFTRRAYVFMLSSEGIVLGDSMNNFNPKMKLTRAVTATMLSRAISYMETNNIKMRITRFSEYKTYGVIAGVGSGTLLLKTYTGSVIQLPLPPTAYVKVNSSDGTLSVSHVGKAVTLVWSKEDKSLKGLMIDTATVVVQGVIKGVDVETVTAKVYITDLATGAITNHALAALPTFYYNNAVVKLKDLGIGNYITVFLNNGVISTAYTYPGSYAVTAVLDSITYGDPISMTITDTTGVESVLSLDPDKLPLIMKGGAISAVDKLRSGDTLTFTYKDCVINKIDAVAQTASLTGTITRIIKDSTGYILTITNSNGTVLEYMLSSDVVIVKGTTAVSIENLKIGSNAAFAASGNFVTRIEVSETAASTSALSGTVLYINSTDRTVLTQTVSSTGSSVNVSVKLMGNTRILTASTGYEIQLSSLKIYDTLDIYGTYNGDQFNATIIIVR